MDRLNSIFLKRFIIPFGDKLMGTHLAYYYKKIKDMQEWNSTQIENWQNENLNKLVTYAYNNTIYYRELFAELEIRPDDIQNIADLSKIPVLTRQMIIDNFEKLVSKEIKSISHIKANTGGTTSTPLYYLLDRRSWSHTNANYILNWERAGYKFGDKYVSLGGSSLFSGKISFKHKLYYKIKRKIVLDGMKMNEEDCLQYYNLIKKQKIRFIYGYASSIYLFAKTLSENHLTLNISACFTTSEILLDSYREVIQDTFGCSIVNCYGAPDGGITAFEHNKNNFEVGYSSIVRIVNTSEVESLDPHPVLVTDILNYAMPFINYQLGDEVKINKGIKSYNGQVIEKVMGRTPDIIRLENGNILTGFSFFERVFKLPIRTWSMEKNGINSLIVKVVKTNLYNDFHEKELIAKLKEYAGNDVSIVVNYYDRFEVTKNGKRNYFINR